MQPAELQTPDRPGLEPKPADAWWGNLSPALRAAITVAVVVILLEVLSDAIPAVGFILTIPFATVTYYVQGILAGRFLRNDPRFPNPGAGTYLWNGIVSAFWTGVVISTAITLIVSLLLGSVTLGAILAAIPLVLVSSLVDIALNFIFTGLGALFYGLFKGRTLVGVSCAMMAVGMSVLCLAMTALAAAVIFGGINLLRHLSL